MNRARGRRNKIARWTWAVADGVIWFGSVYAAALLRYDFHTARALVHATFVFACVAALLHVAVGAALGPYRVGHLRGSFEETADISRAVTITAGLLIFISLSVEAAVPRSVPLIGAAVAVSGMFAARFLVRSVRASMAQEHLGDRRVIIFGAGDAGRRMIRSMREPGSGYFPVALLDDDRHKRRLRIDGVPVRGTRDDMQKVAEKHDAVALVIALPLADAALVRELTDRATAAELDALVLPPLHDIIGGRATTRDLRDVNVEDLLGRRPIKLDTTAIAEQIAGRSVLVTGAGGSIGSELCRQIARFGPAKLYMLDRDESGLLATQMSLTGDGLLQSDQVMLADIRDLEAIRAVFAAARPDLVFHTAALKHLPLLEAFPLEGWKTNVMGTLNVLTAAAETGVGTFVNISTDKAAQPTCVLGYSKRVAERLTADFAATQPGQYVSVRFGNVLGSRGSVLHTFTAQIARGGPVTITHPEVERFFMLIPEACQLVLEAAAIGRDGEVMVLDMGEQVKIRDVADTLIRMSGRKDVSISYTGLRHGEKLSEDLFSAGEGAKPSSNPLITSVGVPSLDASSVALLDIASHPAATSWMRATALDAESAIPAEASA